ncbi:MAG TPA: endonuclease/exonuclease/phosphatase family protein [Verrucomicrobiae bacterium]|nr:endonuclease/exonuclease/phosphatase family protein [Verrucomicrobiae bacterium]
MHFRLLTYNVHGCRGRDRRVSTTRIAEVIASTSADVVALQEVDLHRKRSAYQDQAEVIAARLSMDFHFHPAWNLAGEQLGDAVLSRLPMHLIRAGALPSSSRWKRERRGALWVRVEIDGQALQVINTHLGLNSRNRLAQTEALFGPEWLGHPQCRPPLALCGDFNARPGSRVHRRVLEQLRDVHAGLRVRRHRRTFPTRYPVASLDHVFLTPEVGVYHVEVVRTPLTRAASDHYPLLVELDLT